jgi:hypothetical protein
MRNGVVALILVKIINVISGDSMAKIINEVRARYGIFVEKFTFNKINNTWNRIAEIETFVVKSHYDERLLELKELAIFNPEIPERTIFLDLGAIYSVQARDYDTVDRFA